MRTLILTTENSQQYNSIIELALKLNVKFKEAFEKKETDNTVLMKMAESSFAKDWNKKEDEVWDNFLKNAADVSTR